jgi:UDP-glucose 4-epimerase
MANIFVTGGGGFIGRNTIPTLLSQQHVISALERHSNLAVPANLRLSIVHGALEDAVDTLRPLLRDCDTLLHLAGGTTPASSANNFALEIQKNLTPFLNLLEAAKDTAIKRIIVLSSGGTIYGRPQYTPIDEHHPTNPTVCYGLGKLTIEHLTRLWATQHAREYVLLRAANPYGPHQIGRNNQGVIGVWLQRVLNMQPLAVWGDGTTVRDYLYVDDLAEALNLACSQRSLASGIYNIGSGEGHSLLQIADAIAQVTHIQPRLLFTPGMPYDVNINVLCPKSFCNASGWQAKIKLTEGIKRTYDFLRR